jgi:hypothetical protein
MYRVKTAKIMTADVYFHTDLRTAERWLEDVFFDRSNDLRSGSISHAKDKAGNNSAEIYIPRDSVEDRDLGDTKDRIFKRWRQNDLNVDRNQTDLQCATRHFERLTKKM